MANGQTWAQEMTARRTRFMHRIHARLAARRNGTTSFVVQPEPRTIGHVARGRQLVAGQFLFSGHLIEASDTAIWDIGPADAPYMPEVQGCVWLDDLAAVGDAAARARAQAWVFGWIDRYGRGTGPGWTPELTARRLVRWINHAPFLLRGQDEAAEARFLQSLTQQAAFLAGRWQTAPPGLPRFEALTGMIHAALSLRGLEAQVAPAVAALAQDCRTRVDLHGGVPTRNPEHLLEVFMLLIGAAQALVEADQPPPDAVLSAIARIAPTLRALRHADGGLARFHGGGRGLDGRLDHALAASGVKTRRVLGLHMGFARLSAGRTSVIVDASAPPRGEASYQAHASTLAFELTSGRRPLIVNCGSGARFGQDWHRAGRATPSHSTLGLDGYSSSRLGGTGRGGTGRELLVDVPGRVQHVRTDMPEGTRLEMAHNGYQRTHGLTHARTLDLAADGRVLSGEELLTTLSDGDAARFDGAMDAARLQGIPFAIRFHLHPDVGATVEPGGAAVSLALKSGEIWVFRSDGKAEMRIEPSVYLENGRLRPRATQQVVLSGRAMSYATRIRWTLAKAQDTPDSLRDLAPDFGATDTGDDDD